MAIGTEYILDGKLVEIGLANRFQDSIRNSKVTKCETKEIELKILKAEPTTVLIVKSSLITSPKNITSVDEYKEVLDNC